MPTYITDVYIVKLNAAGELVWGKSIASDGINQAWGVCVDEIGSVYVTGNFARKTDFNPSPRPEDTFYLETSSGTSGDAFVLKLSENGDFVWAAQFVSLGGGDAGKAIFAKNGYVYTTGLYQGKADFNPSPAPADTFYLYPNGNVNSALDIFISKLDTAGNFVWAKSVGSPTNNILREWGTGITVDEAGNVYVGGYYTGDAEFNPGGVSQMLSSTPSNQPDGFVLKLDANGDFVWVRGFAGLREDKVQGIAYDGQDGLYITGSFEQALDVDPDPTVINYIYAAGGTDGFLIKLDTAGTFQWAKQVSGLGLDGGMGVGVDAVGNVYTAGMFVDSAVVDTTGGIVVYVDEEGPDWEDTYITKHDRNGKFIWAKSFGNFDWVYPNGLSVNKSGHVFTTGLFALPTNFDTETGNFTLTPAGAFDPFIHKLHCHDTNSLHLTVNICSPEVYIVHKDTLSASGQYTWIFPNQTGCDSTVTLDLTVHTITTPVINVNGNELSAPGTYNSYQWIRNDTAIQGATSSVYTVTDNGKYQVAVTNDNGCEDTSAAYDITNIGVDEINRISAAISIYPNPVRTAIYVDAPVPVHVTITDIAGKVLHEEDNATKISVEDLSSGIYMIQVKNQEGVLIRAEKFNKIR